MGSSGGMWWYLGTRAPVNHWQGWDFVEGRTRNWSGWDEVHLPGVISGSTLVDTKVQITHRKGWDLEEGMRRGMVDC